MGNTTTHRALERNFKESDHLEDLDVLVQGRIILKWVLKKWHGRKGTRFMWLWKRTRDRLM
jgi:hypothetical protein